MFESDESAPSFLERSLSAALPHSADVDLFVPELAWRVRWLVDPLLAVHQQEPVGRLRPRWQPGRSSRTGR